MTGLVNRLPGKRGPATVGTVVEKHLDAARRSCPPRRRFAMQPGVDPLMPFGSRFPLSPAQGRVDPSTAWPAVSGLRPFGMC